MKILVFGGTRFFGRHLINCLLDHGHEVTVATRGNEELNFAASVSHHKIDRTNEASLIRLAQATGDFDLIYDQICFSPIEAKLLCDNFAGKTGRLIFTSSQSVYNYGKNQSESSFDPFKLEIEMKPMEKLGYAAAKRHSEAYYFQRSPFDVVAVRFPLVLGTDDYTGRLSFHVKKIINQKPIYFPDLKAKISMIDSKSAGKFLCWLSSNNIQGPINACSTGDLSLEELLNMIEKATGKKAILTNVQDDPATSPYGIENDCTMDSSRAVNAGFEFDEIHNWLPKLIENEVETILKTSAAAAVAES